MNSDSGGPGAALERISRGVDALASAICAVFFGAMTAAVLTGVFFRYILNSPLSWTEEVSRYLMIWGASVGISLGIRAEEHVGLTILLDSIKSRAVRMVFHTVIFILVLGFLGILFLYSVRMALDARYMQTQALGVPMYVAYAAVPVSSALAAVQLALMYGLKAVRGDQQHRDLKILDI